MSCTRGLLLLLRKKFAKCKKDNAGREIFAISRPVFLFSADIHKKELHL